MTSHSESIRSSDWKAEVVRLQNHRLYHSPVEAGRVNLVCVRHCSFGQCWLKSQPLSTNFFLMQHSPHDIKEKLLKALDKDYNVVDMPVVVEIIGILERTPITKEDLETTRLGKYVNELRRKTTNEQVAKRAKDLVRKWRDMIIPHGTSGGDGGGGGPNQNGTRPSVGTGRIVSPAIGRSLSPGSWNRSCPISPALSLKRSQPASPASRINSLSPDNRLALSPGSQKVTVSPSISPRSQVGSVKSNQTTQLPQLSGEPTTANLPPGTTIARTPEQTASSPAPRPRGRPPLNRTSLDSVKSPPRPRGRPPLDHTDGEVPRGRGRPPSDPTKAEHRGRGRPPSSSPSSGVPPRGRGRPPKNKNKLKKLTSSPESNQNSNLVPKNNPANKRLRKSSDEDEESVAKKQKLNGVYDCKVPDIVNSNEEKAGDDPNQVPSEQIKIPKKRGRKKGSKNAPKKLPFDRYEEDVVKEKMASIVRNPKVKTTRELLECIQKESSLDNLRNKTLSSLGVDGDKTKSLSPSHKLLTKNDIDYDMTLSKTEHIHKFLRSQNEAEEDFGHGSIVDVVNDHRVETKAEKSETDTKPDSRPLSRVSDAIGPIVISESSRSPEILDPVEEDIIDVEKIDSAEDSPLKAKKLETVEEILAKLPAINPEEILWSDSESSDSDEEPREVIVTENDIDSLHGQHIEGVNGNWNDGALIKGLNHGLKVPIDDISIDGDKDLKPNSKPNKETVGDDEQLDRNSNNLQVNKGNHEDNFREWQECVSKTSYNGELLHILPYVIID